MHRSQLKFKKKVKEIINFVLDSLHGHIICGHTIIVDYGKYTVKLAIALKGTLNLYFLSEILTICSS